MRTLFPIVMLASLAAAIQPVLAQSPAYPVKPVRNVVPTPPAGPLDLLVRLVGAKLSERLGQPFVIDNRPGAFGNVGAAFVAKAEPDGHTLLWVVDASMTANPHLYKLEFDPQRDFTPIAMVTESGSALVVHPSITASSVKELIAVAKSKPLAYASGGNGSPGHLLGEQFKVATGVSMTHVPYNGNAPAVQSIVSGTTQVFLSSIPGVLPHVRSGKLRALAVTLPRRSQHMPELPTLHEAGVAADTTSWFGLYGPARLPQPVVDLLFREVAAAVKSPDLSDKLQGMGLEPTVVPAEALSARVRSDSAKWAAVIKQANIRVE